MASAVWQTGARAKMRASQRGITVVASAVGVVAVYVLDRATGLLPDVTIFYLVPVIATTYVLGAPWGLGMAAAALLASLTAHPPAHRAVVAADGATHFVVFAVAALAVDRLASQLRTIRELRDRDRKELEIARTLHQSLLPELPPDAPVRLAYRMQSARELGGDYAWFHSADDGLVLCVADISGKGVSAALFATLLHDTVTEAARRWPWDPAGIVRQINEVMHRAMPDDMFVTMFLAWVTRSDMSYVNAGHELPLLRHADGVIETLGTPGGMPLGVVTPLDAPVRVLQTAPGDLLLVFTDGVTDSDAFRKGDADLIEIVRTLSDPDPEALAELIMRTAVPSAEEYPRDDVTVVALAWPD